MRKISIPLKCNSFKKELTDTMAFIDFSKSAFSERDADLSRCYDYAIICLYKNFEQFILQVIVACVNHDSSALSESSGVKFGRHINDDICEYLVTGGGYFDFHSRDDLIKILNHKIGKSHSVTGIIKDNAYKKALEQLSALRNYAAHGSKQSKKAALKSIGLSRMATAGSWLKIGERLEKITSKLSAIADEICGLYNTGTNIYPSNSKPDNSGLL